MKTDKLIKIAALIVAVLTLLSACSSDLPAATTAQPDATVKETGKATEPPATEEPTEQITAAPTDPATEAHTEPATEAPTVPATEAPAEPATEAPTEPATEAPTEPATETPTEPVTEAPTEKVTEAPAEPVTEAPTEPVTDAPTPPPEDVYSAGDVKYTAKGFKSEKNGVFTVSGELELTLEKNSLKTDFNRMSFTYSSDRPLRLYVTYYVSGSEKTDDFYFEAGDNAVFNGLLSTYLNGTKGNGVKSLKIVSCEGKQFDFSLSGISVEVIKVYNSATYYLENERFKLGIRLSWGGGINYIYDKTSSISGLKNLINSHDTGRLIQQSYYGTAGNSEYKPGKFNGSTWVYNPVQGGDQYGNASRLIDIVVGDDYVYIKAQPQDWSLNNKISRSYMENKYTLLSDCIRVDNRFVDFSGWEHRYANQELPAFYTVSYLDRFTWYNGSDSWTDAELSYRDDLKFWGDAQYAADCRFPIKEDNTETWCAWTSKTSGFGVGLYVPNVDMFYAGKYNYNCSKSSDNDATNYVAPLNTLKIISYVPIEYGYLITTGTVEQIRATFKANKDFTDNASLHNNYITMRITDTDYANITFGSAASVTVFGDPYNTEISYSETEKAAVLKVATPNDPQVMIDFTRADKTYNAEDYQTIEITYMIPKSNSRGTYETDLFLCTGNKMAPDGSERTRVTLTRDGEYHTVTVNVGSLAFWKGKINKIRFDYFDACAKGDVIYVKSFVLK